MILIEVKKGKAKENEAYIIEALADTIRQDLTGMNCPNCKTDSKVQIKVDKNRFNSLSTKVEACCVDFKQKIENSLLIIDEISG